MLYRADTFPILDHIERLVILHTFRRIRQQKIRIAVLVQVKAQRICRKALYTLNKIFTDQAAEIPHTKRFKNINIKSQGFPSAQRAFPMKSKLYSLEKPFKRRFQGKNQFF